MQRSVAVSSRVIAYWNSQLLSMTVRKSEGTQRIADYKQTTINWNFNDAHHIFEMCACKFWPCCGLSRLIFFQKQSEVRKAFEKKRYLRNNILNIFQILEEIRFQVVFAKTWVNAGTILLCHS